MTSSQDMMVVPNLAKEQLLKLSQENQQLKHLHRDQQFLMNDFLESIPDLEEVEKSIENINNKLEETTYQVEQAQNILFELLNQEFSKSNNFQNQVGSILSSLLKNFQSSLLKICSTSASEGNVGVSIFTLMDFEEEVSKIIETLSNKGFYPENEEQLKTRSEISHKHTNKLIEFLNQLKSKME